jgi:nicotianamine synthase
MGSGYTRLMEFPYYENYVDLTRMELAAINAVTPSPLRRVVFIGSGPLPLTSLCICEELERNRSEKIPDLNPPPESVIINIDHDPKAMSQSVALCKKLGQRARGMQFTCQEAESLKVELSNCDVVYLAALVGTTQKEKEAVLTSVVEKMQAGSLLVIRTAHSLRTLLYPVRFSCDNDGILTLENSS